MLFLVDANLPRSVAVLLQRLGHGVDFVRDIGMGAAADRELAGRAIRTGAVLLTRDLDFADVRQYPPQEHAGIVVLRLPDDATAHAIANIVERFVEQAAFLDSPRGRLAVIETGRVRFRPPVDAP